jgi:hypothetical protein
MGFAFIERQGERRVPIVTVNDNGRWFGDEVVIERIREILKKKGLQVTNPDHAEEILALFGGSYFWATKTIRSSVDLK